MGPLPDSTGVFVAGFVLLCVSVPLAIWKVVEVVIWLFSHVSISLN